MSNGIREMARRANIGGDIKLRQFREQQRERAEDALSKFADAAKSKTSGKYAGEDAVELLKFISSFSKDPLAVALNTALTGVDAGADFTSSKKKEKELKSFRDALLSQYESSPYAQYLSANVGQLSSQAQQSLSGQRKADLMSKALDFGKKGVKLVEGKKGEMLKETLEKYNPLGKLEDVKVKDAFKEIFKKAGEGSVKQGGEEILEEGAKKGLLKNLVDRLGFGPKAGASPSPMEGIDIFDLDDNEWGEPLKQKFKKVPTPAPFGFTGFGGNGEDYRYFPVTEKSNELDFVKNLISKIKMPENKIDMSNILKDYQIEGPTLGDVYTYLQPRIAESMRPYQEPVVPGAQRGQGSNIRRRIIE